MDAKEIAEMLDGIDYGELINERGKVKEIVGLAEEFDIVIVYGASDDLMEFRGAIEDEADCYDGGEVYFDETGVYGDPELADNLINAVWADEEQKASWTYETDIPHEEFKVYDEGVLYCIGIVFSTSDLV
ncbi:MAG: hypothetical protein ILA17_06085 [Ruminococcus sp.]|nr:hypothetical protein [Ruminiclostridium sp.]MBP1537418.1 hypothetical protein [Ruminococcus sp.]